MNDNVLDPYHVHILHSTLTGPQFAREFELMPKVSFFKTDAGICYSAVRELPDGRSVDRISSWLMPNIMSVPDIYLKEGKSAMVAWNVAVDDTHFTQAVVTRMAHGREFQELRFEGKRWHEMSEAERQRRPGDFEAQAGQGPLTRHSEEHLVTSDRGIIMLRRMLKAQMKRVEQGEDPVGVVFNEDQALVEIRSGNFFLKGKVTEDRIS